MNRHVADPRPTIPETSFSSNALHPVVGDHPCMGVITAQHVMQIAISVVLKAIFRSCASQRARIGTVPVECDDDVLLLPWTGTYP